jgi:polar amino acid transport system substrate-binding protein
MRLPIKLFAICILLVQLVAPAMADEEITLYLMEVKPYTIDSPERKGIVGDVVLEAMRRAGYRPKIIVVPSPRALLLVPDLQNTLIIPLARLKEREADFTWIARVMNVDRAFFTIDKKVNSFDEAKATFKSIGVARGSAGLRILLDQGFDKAKIEEVNQGVTAVKMLQAERFEAWYSPILEAQQLEKDAGAPEFAMSPPLGPTEQYLGCSKRCDETMVKRLSEVIKEMRQEGLIKKIAASYRE